MASHRTWSTLGRDRGQLYKALFHQQPRQPMTRVVGVASHHRPPGPSMSSAPVPTYTRWPWHQPGIHFFNGPWSQNCPAEGGECPAGWGLCPITSPVTPSIFTPSCLCSEGRGSQHPVKDSGLRRARQPGSPRGRPGTGTAGQGMPPYFLNTRDRELARGLLRGSVYVNFIFPSCQDCTMK